MALTKQEQIRESVLEFLTIPEVVTVIEGCVIKDSANFLLDAITMHVNETKKGTICFRIRNNSENGIIEFKKEYPIKD